MRRRAILAMLCASLVGAPTLAAREKAPPEPLVFKATRSGAQTLDQGEGGGNPFASALIESLAGRGRLRDLPASLTALTDRYSDGFQEADTPRTVTPPDLPLVARTTSERRIAWVLVFSAYSPSSGLQPLAGTRRDAARVSAALRAAGYETTVSVDPPRETLAVASQAFSKRSERTDVSVIYTTGHGVELSGTGYLIPNDYPLAAGGSVLEKRAIRLDALARLMRARKANLFFYAGCRDNPLGWSPIDRRRSLPK